ncbi:hypothetical protein ACLB2K_032188 [Fragaria x ananassa]
MLTFRRHRDLYLAEEKQGFEVYAPNHFARQLGFVQGVPYSLFYSVNKHTSWHTIGEANRVTPLVNIFPFTPGINLAYLSWWRSLSDNHWEYENDDIFATIFSPLHDTLGESDRAILDVPHGQVRTPQRVAAKPRLAVMCLSCRVNDAEAQVAAQERVRQALVNKMVSILNQFEDIKVSETALENQCTIYTRQVETLEAQIAELQVQLAQARHNLAWAKGVEARVQAAEDSLISFRFLCCPRIRILALGNNNCYGSEQVFH